MYKLLLYFEHIHHFIAVVDWTSSGHRCNEYFYLVFMNIALNRCVKATINTESLLEKGHEGIYCFTAETKQIN